MEKKRGKAIRSVAAGLCLLAAVYALFRTAAVAGAVDTADTETLGNALGAVSLAPTLIAIIVAFVFKDVMLSLLSGLVCGALMAVSLQGAPLPTFFTAVCERVIDTVSDRDNAAILLLCFSVGGMIEVIRFSGGFETLAEHVTRRVNTPRKANLITELLGIIVFFDDYANTLIVGPVMRPITDKQGVSREKLAYLVDSTAAPVTGMAIISSWVAVEVAVIEEGLANAGSQLSGYGVFIRSIPFCFYCIFCLVFIALSTATGREFGPMLRAENRARRGEPLRRDSLVYRREQENSQFFEYRNEKRSSPWTAIVPLIVLFLFSLIRFYTQGRAAAVAMGRLAADAPFSLSTLAECFGAADTIFIVLEAILLAALIAIVMGLAQRTFTLKEAVDAFVRGCAQLLQTVIILAFAWSMSSFVAQIGTVNYAVNIISANVSWWLIPTLIFAVCCLVSFAVGSYGCMFIALPIAIPIAVRMAALYAGIPAQFLPLCVGCGLAGSIFGDHCSPITDCTILSSEGCGCDNFDHVYTQLPYALTTAGVAVAAGILPGTFGLPVWASLLMGSGAFLALLLLIGRVPEAERSE